MKDKLLNISSFLFGILLPLSTKFGNLGLAFFLACCLVIVVEEKRIRKPAKTLLFSTISFFLLLVIGLYFTEEKAETFELFGRYSTYLLVPFFLLFINKDRLLSVYQFSLNGLVIGVTIASLILLTNNFTRYYSVKPLFTIDKELFNYYYTYHNFTKILRFHPTYFGLYLIVAVTHTLSKVTKEQQKWLRFFGYFALFVFALTILFLNARIIVGLSFVVYFYYLFLFIKGQYKVNKTKFFLFFFGVLLLGSIFFGFIKNTYLFSRFTSELVWDLTSNKNSAYNGKFKDDSRLVRWAAISKTILEKPFFGYGSAMEKKVLKRNFLKNGLVKSSQNNYDSHNQYLSFSIEFGLLGLLVFLFYLSMNMHLAIHSKNFVPIIFCITIISVSFFENIFKNNAGIIFITFFSNLFLYRNLDEKNQ
jgi:O-antigen ligase